MDLFPCPSLLILASLTLEEFLPASQLEALGGGFMSLELLGHNSVRDNEGKSWEVVHSMPRKERVSNGT